MKTDTPLSNTGNFKMLAEFYNAMREMETEDEFYPAPIQLVAGEKSKEASSTSTASNDGAVQGSGQVAQLARVSGVMA
jgi:hypothetical protein